MEILNQQKIKKLNTKNLKRYLKKIFFYLSIKEKKASFVFCNNQFITELNYNHFNKNAVTDVISFPLADDLEPNYLGEVVVSVEEAVLVAEELQLNWQKELLLYTIHGILHLIGFKDKTLLQRKKMEKKQQKVLAKFKKIEVG
ncbi:MAG: rRNA maturation RNase YbeY [Candidatus Omnitrophica bacterium]|nr:rRNA maturation RNase YbeY [Candidatus Omnitrophota bacterium]MCF7894159.1 rRNA maturation RNase YbeY [Candidatus Omnitrophota bacterium]